MQLPTNKNLSNTLGDLSNDQNDVQTRITLLEKKIGIKESTTSDFSNDYNLKLPVNKTLGDVLGKNMLDFNSSSNEPTNPEPSNTAVHDDLITIMRKLGRLCLGNLNTYPNLKYYNYTLSQILGNLSNYDLEELGDIITRLLNTESNINNINNNLSVINNANTPTTLNDYLDYYISINNNGSIINSGMLGKNINSNSLTKTAVLYNANRTFSHSTVDTDEFIKKNNTSWLFNNSVNNTSNSMAMINVNTSNYLGSGFTVVFYVTDFTSSNINNLFSIVTPCKSRQNINRITQLRVSSTDTNLKINTYESSTDNILGGELPSIPGVPNYSYNNENKNFAFSDNNPITSNTNAVWFIAVTFSGYFSDDYNVKGDESLENKGGIQVFYKRSDSFILNKSSKWIPNFQEGNNNVAQGGLSRFFDDYSWIIFGGKAVNPQGDLSTDYFTMSDYTNNKIENPYSVESSNCSIGEMSLFNKALSNDEIKELSRLTPEQYINRFRK